MTTIGKAGVAAVNIRNGWHCITCWPIILISLIVQLSSLVLPAMAQDWPQWRGPNRDGIAAGMTLSDSCLKNLRQIWKIEVGGGHSAPVVVGSEVYLMARQEENEVILCLRREDGREIWRYSYEAPYTPRADARPHGKGPKATLTVASDKVYSFGVTGTLTCLWRETGKLLWQKRFSSEFEKTYPLYGASNSPLIEGNLCIVGIGGHNDGALAGFNVDTGEIAWKLTVDGPSYASPIAADLAGQRQVIALMQSRLVGVAAGTGRLLWEVPFTTAYDMNIITPIVYKEIVIYSGYGKATMAVRIVKAAEKLTVEPVWDIRELSMYMSSPVVHGDYLYGFSQRRGGTFMCVGLQDGRKAWSSPSGMGKYVSIVRAGDKLLLLTTKGELILAAAAPSGYKELARTQVADSPVWAYLAMAANRVYVKDKTHLACFELGNQ